MIYLLDINLLLNNCSEVSSLARRVLFTLEGRAGYNRSKTKNTLYLFYWKFHRCKLIIVKILIFVKKDSSLILQLKTRFDLIFKCFVFFQIGEVYEKDPLRLELSTDYWCPMEPLGSVFSPRPINAVKKSLIQKQVIFVFLIFM